MKNKPNRTPVYHEMRTAGGPVQIPVNRKAKRIAMAEQQKQVTADRLRLRKRAARAKS